MDREAQGVTHTQSNEVFTDNSNCQILLPNDIEQSADANNSLSQTPGLCSSGQGDLISGKNETEGQWRPGC